jgi:choline-sulfatase
MDAAAHDQIETPEKEWKMDGKTPNILVVMADQLSPTFLPIHGRKIVKAPTIEALAASGVVFDSAYCNSPLCSPSRAVFMSGRLPSNTGVYDNAAEFRSDIPTFAHYLRLIGYRTILSGKMHFCGADQMHGFEKRLTTDIYPADFGWTPDWDNPLKRPNWYHNMSSVTEAGLCVRTNQLDFDEEVVFACERALYDHVRSPDKRPFLMVASLTHPHDPFAIPEKYWNLYRDEDIEAPAFTIPNDQYDPHSLRLRRVCAMGATEVTQAQIRTARRAYYGAISYVDDNLGKLMRALRETGLANDTIVIFTSDHGEMLGERGLWFKMNFFEGSARVPMIFGGANRFVPRRVSANVSLVDLLPTLVDLGGGDSTALAASIDGASLAPWLQGRAGKDEVIGEYLAEGAIAPVLMIRRGRLKFIHSPQDPDMLFDLSTDPEERKNLAARPRERTRVAEFRKEISQRWDLPKLDTQVRESQRRRRIVDAALNVGEAHAWDFQPFRDASRSYVRNTIPLDDLEAMARFPPIDDTAKLY